MISKRAFFYWENVEWLDRPWIRQECLDSFRRHNPSWEVVMLEGDREAIPGSAYLNIVHRSDLARYVALRDLGGIYFDTDMIFAKPIPEGWLRGDLLLPMTVDNSFVQVAAIGSVQGHRFFDAVVTECHRIIEAGRNMAYQALGVVSMSRCVNYAMGADVHWLKSESVLPVPWTATHVIWNQGDLGCIPASTVAFHWFGGDPLSRHMESVVDEEWAMTSDALLAQWIRKSRAV